MNRIFSLFFLLLISLTSLAQDWANHNRYAAQNELITNRPKAVFMGNSITDNWAKFQPEFFRSYFSLRFFLFKIYLIYVFYL